MSAYKKRVSMILTLPFQDALDSLVAKGVYVDHQDAMRAALRSLFRFHGMPLTPEEVSGW